MTTSILLTTLPPISGGVPAKAEILARHLRSLGHRVTIAHYATLSDYPELVAPLWQLPTGKKPCVRTSTCFGDFPCVSIGCVLPELEFTYYRPSQLWREQIEAHDRHIAVGGTVLVSLPLVAAGVPHVTWCASTMIADRIDRRLAMPPLRRLVDSTVIGPVQRRMEKRILSGRHPVMTVSRYTRETLIKAGAKEERCHLVPIPVDLDRFRLPDKSAETGVIGFAGRPTDPRKNLPVLFAAVALLRARGMKIRLRLTGNPTSELERSIHLSGIDGAVIWAGWLPDEKLPEFFKELDLFVIPSTQEGLNIAGTQALACGVPVVSTRCGGPEDYVLDDETGFLTEIRPEALAEAIAKIVASRPLRKRLGQAGRELVERDYGHARFSAAFEGAWNQAWGDRP